MEHTSIISPGVDIELKSWRLKGDGITESEKKIKHLEGVFADENALRLLDPEFTVYSVQAHLPLKEGTEGGLYFGTTIIQPGKVGCEYFMTRGHFHASINRAEYYWGVQGEGMLILMDQARNTWAERMFPGSLHFIPGKVAHRVANTGNTPLIFGACWPSDAGHNYEEISNNGFSARLFDINGKPVLK
jgi:glucose-6-phosphate isomerase